MGEFRRGWGVLVAAILGTGCGLIGITHYTQGLFVGPVTETFGWGRGEFYFGFTLMMVAGLVTAPIVGSVADKRGARLVGMVGLAGHAVSYLLLAVNPGSLMLWYFNFITLAVFAAGSLPITWTSVVNHWFLKNRGLAIGLTMSGTGLVALTAPPYVEYLNSTFGWRVGYAVLGLTALAISFPAVWFLFKENIEQGEAEESERQALAWGMTRSEALRSYRFWVLGSALALTTIVIVGYISNFVPILAGKGITSAEAAKVASVMGATIIFGRLLVGFLLDRFWAPGVAAVFFLFPVLSILLLLNVELTPTVVIACAILLGLAAGAELDLLAFLTSKFFGVKHYGAVFGGIFAFFTVSAGIAPPIYGGSYDSTGSYTMILNLSVAMLLIASALFLSLGKPPQAETHH